MARLLSVRRAELGSDDPLIAPIPTSTSLPDWLKTRSLLLGGEPAVHIGNTCDTCGFYFELADVPIDSRTLGVLRDALAGGLGRIDEAVAGRFGMLLAKGEYIVALIECVPLRVEPCGAGDYFHEEQAVLEGTEPGNEYDEPFLVNTPYYRLEGRSRFETGPGWYGASGVGFDFIVPIVRPLDPAASASHAARIGAGLRPTAVSLSLLDIKQPHDGDAHWCMAHYLLDGHHKVDAAARLGRAITLLSFMPLKGGFCCEEHLGLFLSTYEAAGNVDAELVSAFPPAD
jgi:hypothetical protein